jgi:UDP-N-acetylglucosamine acyltransferase
MAGCHIGHDSEIGKNCSLAPFSLLAGHTILCDGVTFGQGVVTHPWTVIGEHAMIGLNSGVLDDVAPYQKVVGSPAKLIGKNTGATGIRKGWDLHGLDTEVVKRYVAVQVRRDNNKELMKELMAQ